MVSSGWDRGRYLANTALGIALQALILFLISCQLSFGQSLADPRAESAIGIDWLI